MNSLFCHNAFVVIYFWLNDGVDKHGADLVVGSDLAEQLEISGGDMRSSGNKVCDLRHDRTYKLAMYSINNAQNQFRKSEFIGSLRFFDFPWLCPACMHWVFLKSLCLGTPGLLTLLLGVCDVAMNSSMFSLRVLSLSGLTCIAFE